MEGMAQSQRSAASWSGSGSGSATKRERDAGEGLREFAGCTSLTTEEITILRDGLGDPVSYEVGDNETLKSQSRLIKPRFKERVTTFAGGRTRKTEANLAPGDFILLPTQAFEDTWNLAETGGQFNIAIGELVAATEAQEGKERLSFKIRGHTFPYDPGQGDSSFALTGRTLVAEFMPQYVLIPEESVADGLKARFHGGGGGNGRALRGGSGKFVGRTGRGDLSDSKDDARTSFVDQDNRLRELKSARMEKYEDHLTLYHRAMDERKQEILVRERTDYSRKVWDEALAPYLEGSVKSGDAEMQTLCECYRMQEMPIIKDAEKMDRARQCQFLTRDWKNLSVMDFVENPGGQASMEGNTRGSRLALLAGVEGYLTFLSIVFYARAEELWGRLRTWLRRPNPPNGPHWETIFLRARIESAVVYFWGEVRSGLRVSTRFPDRSFDVPGDIWRLWADFETDMMMAIALNPMPHTAFRAKGGELSQIRGASPFESGGQRKEEPKQGASQQVCTYQLGHDLKLTSSSGSLWGACTKGLGCSNKHVELGSTTVGEVLESVRSGTSGALEGKLAKAVQENAHLFKK